MSLPDEGSIIDGFRLGPRIHAGAMATIHRVDYADGRPPPFPMLMKIPKLAPGEGSENIVGFEIEHQMLQCLDGSHVPRFVAAGDLSSLPYLVIEYLAGQTLERWIEDRRAERKPIGIDEIAHTGALAAQALQRLHQQKVCHLDLKPANLMRVSDDRIALLDFGLSCHADLPDLLAEEMRPAVGSPAWIAPEQVVGTRGDPRSDLFALGVILYEMATGELPFGAPTTRGGLRQRLWMEPVPPRLLRPDLPPWLQEAILRCLEPYAEDRYASAAVLAFDLRHPEQIRIGERGERTRKTGFGKLLRRWLRAAGREYQPSPLPAEQQANRAPIVMVAIPNHDVTDETLYTLRRATARSLGTRPGARLAVVTVIKPSAFSDDEPSRSETTLHRRHLASLQRWAQGLDLSDHQMSCHVLQGSDVAQVLLDYASGNDVDLIVMGAATHGLSTQRFIATVPIRVAMHAPCTVILVKEPEPFSQLRADDHLE